MKNKSLMLMVVLILISSALTFNVLAGGSIIVITPQWPITQGTPATLQIRVVGPADPTYDPHILLAMTVACWDGLPENPNVAVEIAWTGGSVPFYKNDFELLEGNPPPKIPPDSISDVQYTRSSLADHLGESGDSPVYWAMKPFPVPPDGQLHTTAQTFTVTLHSTNPRMLVYAIGRSSHNPSKFDRWVPPTNPGFIIPEPATIIAVMTSLAALFVYTIRRKKTLP